MDKKVLSLFRVRFAELYEVQSAFGQELIAPAGGGFPKYLIYSYDLKTKTIVFPRGWSIVESGGTNEDNWKRTQWDFQFGKIWHTVLLHKYVRKIDFVEVEYDEDEFRPDNNLVLMTLRVPRRNKNRADRLIQERQAAKAVLAMRSRESRKIVQKPECMERSFPQYLYELAVRKSEYQNFVERLFERNLISKSDRYAILVDPAGIFPRQLACLKDSH